MSRKNGTMIAAIALGAAVFLSGGCASESETSAYYESIVVTEPDLSATQDGVYSGACEIDPPFGIWVAQKRVSVDVSVVANRYEDIVVTERAVQNMQYLETLRDLILSEQSLQVDGLTGATSFTGKAYLKAVESAVTTGAES